MVTDGKFTGTQTEKTHNPIESGDVNSFGPRHYIKAIINKRTGGYHVRRKIIHCKSQGQFS